MGRIALILTRAYCLPREACIPNSGTERRGTQAGMAGFQAATQNTRMNVLLLFALWLGVGGEPARCDASRRGEYRPPAANYSPAILHQAARSGQLRLCVRGRWRYNWEQFSVNVKDLRRK